MRFFFSKKKNTRFKFVCVIVKASDCTNTFGKLLVNQHKVPQLQLARPKLRLIQFQHNNLKKVKISIRTSFKEYVFYSSS